MLVLSGFTAFQSISPWEREYLVLNFGLIKKGSFENNPFMFKIIHRLSLSLIRFEFSLLLSG
jgi:hypothetical protein